MGLAYSALGDKLNAIKYHLQQLEIVRDIGDRRTEGAALLNLGNNYLDLDDILQAIASYEQSLEISREVGDRRIEMNVLGNLGKSYGILNDYEKSIKYYEQARELNREFGDAKHLADQSLILASCYLLAYGKPASQNAYALADEALNIYIKLSLAEQAGQAQDLLRIIQKEMDATYQEFLVFQTAFFALLEASNSEEVFLVFRQYPVLANLQSIKTMEGIAQDSNDPNQRRAIEQRLTWLRQL